MDNVPRYFYLALAVAVAFVAITLGIFIQRTGKSKSDAQMETARNVVTESPTSLIALDGLTIQGLTLKTYIEDLGDVPYLIKTNKNPTGFTEPSNVKSDINYVSPKAQLNIELEYGSSGEVTRVLFVQED